MKISGLALEVLLAKLKGVGGMPGFNEVLANVAPIYRLKPYVIDFPEDAYSDSTPTFIFGQFDERNAPDMLGVTGVTLACMYVIRSSNENYEKPNDFSGVIPVGLDFHLGWKFSEMRQNFELMSLATEDAVAELLQPVGSQNWGELVYDGKLSAVRGPMMKDDQSSFRQKLAFRMTFQLDI